MALYEQAKTVLRTFSFSQRYLRKTIHSGLTQQKSDHEHFAHVALKKKKVQCSKKRANRPFALSLTKNERFAQKTEERITIPGLHTQ